MDSVSNLKAENSRLRLMVKRLMESNKNLSKEVKRHETKEQSISSAILFAVERSNQWDNSMRKLYELGIQRSRLLYAKMERVLNELYSRYPALKKESKLNDMVEKFRYIANGNDVSYSFDEEIENRTSEDPIKKLLNNIISYIDDKKDNRLLKRNPGIASTIDTLTNEYASVPSKSGFNINEALNPTEDLGEILKSFDLGRK